MDISRLNWIEEQPRICKQCADERCEDYDCRVYLALSEIDAMASKAAAAIRDMRHITRDARKVLAEYTGDGLANAADEYSGDINTTLFVKSCGVHPVPEVQR